MVDESRLLPSAETSSDDIDEMPTSPSLDEKREAWMQLSRAFK